MDSSSIEQILNPGSIFTPRIWSNMLNNFSQIPNLHHRLDLVRKMKHKLETELSKSGAQSEPFPISRLFLNDTLRSLEEEEKIIVENIIKCQRTVTNIGNVEAGTSHGRRDANGSQHNAGPGNSITLFGTTISYSETPQAPEPKRQRSSSTQISYPPTFAAFPTMPVGIPQTAYGLHSSLGSTATAVSSSAGNRMYQLSFGSPQGEPSTVVHTNQYPVAPPTQAVAVAPTPAVAVAPARARLDRGKKPMQAGSTSSSVGGRREPNRRHPPRTNRNNTGGRMISFG